MERSSIIKDYFILLLDKKGNMPLLYQKESNAGFVAAGIMDLLFSGIIKLEKNEIIVINPLYGKLTYLYPLYDYLKEKPMKIEKAVNDFCTGNDFKELVSCVSESLYSEKKVVKTKGGFFGKKTLYIPKDDYKTYLINNIKNVITGKKNINMEDVYLICVLDETKNLTKYFSKYEMAEFKVRLKEIKKNEENKELIGVINTISDTISAIANVSRGVAP
ncbi:GPP34 family phosphoprotein [Anaerofustis sp. HA2171]|uniref:GPP34 family phosphoprotein n=1 Tax=Anaerofustis butyriciformans TaxID=3108533 RepID=UPI002E32CD72|nr:GPP34 family phosphoprotein [Anaerofustis sp. HA2171]